MAKANKSFGYTDAFPSRFRDLADEKGCTMEEMAQAFSTTRQTVRNWQNGETIPDAKSICYIASFFSVTTDYLLGLSDVKTPNIEVRAIADRTGLKEDAIIQLCVEKDTGGHEVAALVSYLAENENSAELESLLDAMWNFDSLHKTIYVDSPNGHNYEIDSRSALKFIADGLLWKIFDSSKEAQKNGSDREAKE